MSSKIPIGLMIWLNDDPITGSVISLKEITSPRREYGEYKVGDRVKSRLPGCGVFECVIGKLGDESKRKDFKAIIDSAKFLELVQVHMVTPTRSEQSDTDSSGTITPAAQKRKNSTGQNHHPVQNKNKKPKLMKKKQQTNIEHAASSLELLELDLLTSLEETPSTPQQETVPQLQPVTSNCEQLLQSSTRSSSVIGEALDVLNNTYTNITQPDVQQRLDAMELELSKCWSYIHQLQNQVSWLYNQQQINTTHQQAMENQPCTTVNSEINTSHHDQQTMGNRPCTTVNSEVPLENSLNGTATGQTSYTKEQLMSICRNQPDFAKAAKKLFLRLFKREEYVGRSLTGKAPNKNTPAKPKIENREKLQLLYDVVAEVYDVKKESHINRELADLLKPSRCR